MWYAGLFVTRHERPGGPGPINRRWARSSGPYGVYYDHINLSIFMADLTQ